MIYLFKSFKELLLNFSSKSLMRLFRAPLSTKVKRVSRAKSKKIKAKKKTTAKHKGIKKRCTK